eukprot:Phypoly_transcript_06689.p1 GENE.Phypoly_transcript_06689~~Phypoly_transcript_06689.p1  ORF type:complete len:503 (+),score=185.31 Phypoly_transcript_06689:82-1590(+)
MPPKKAAAGAGGDAPAKAPKAEKAATPPVDDKKPKTQPKQEEKPQNNKGQEKAQDKTQGKGKGKQVEEEPAVETVAVPGKSDRQYEPDDDVEKEIKSRIDKLESEIKVHREEIEQIRSTIENKKDSQVKLKQDQDAAIKSAQGVGDAKSFNDRFNAKMDQIKHFQKLREDKTAEKKELRAQLGRGVVDKKNTYLKDLEAEIKALQDKQASGEIGKLNDEKKIIAEIGRLNNNKKIFKNYAEVDEAINQYDTQITTLRTELETIKSERQDYRDKRKEFDDIITASRDQHKSNSSDIEKAINRRKELSDRVTELRGKVDACYDELRDHRSGKREKAKKERQEEQKKRQEERRQQELKRLKEEEERGCYAEEIEACTQLLQYLEPFKYVPPQEEEKKEEEGEKEEKGEGEEKEKEEGEEAPAVSTPPPSKRAGKKNKPIGETDETKELKHGAQIYFYFETLSLIAPQFVGAVEASLNQISKKKEYVETKEAELRERRKANGTQAV